MIHEAPAPKALVIENDPVIAEEVARILKSLDHEPDFDGDQEAARRKVKVGGYDYVLLKLTIPAQQECEFPRTQKRHQPAGTNSRLAAHAPHTGHCDS